MADGEAEVGVDLFLIIGCAALEPASVRIDKGPEHKGVAGVSRAGGAGGCLDEGRAKSTGRAGGEAERPHTFEERAA